MIKAGLSGKRITFSDADFKSALCISDFDAIRITAIPSSTEGTLMLDGRRVNEGRIIKRRDIGALSFIPASESISECSFKFTLSGYASDAEIECILKFLDRVNYEPTSSACAVQKTQEGISCFGEMQGYDPEGDRLEYIVVLYPESGILELLGDGKYCYTPDGGYTGEDSFTYVCRDEYGNYSKPETVKISVTERMCATVYRDMLGREEYNAAVAMTAMNIMNGRLLGDDFYFMPESEVSRAEFISMALKCAGVRATECSATIFDDDSSISPSLKPYIDAAQKLGVINGEFRDGGLHLSPNESITRYEAASIMASLLGISGDGEGALYAESLDTPVRARGCVEAMGTLGVFDELDLQKASAAVSRGDCAEYLYRLTLLL